MTKFNETLTILGLLALTWLYLSSLASKSRPQKDCSKTYGIDYVLHAKLFCEVKGD